MKKTALTLIIFALIVRLSSALTPGDLSQVTFQQHPGQQLSPDLRFQDEGKRSIALGELFGKQPTILVLGYYRCPMLCTMINDGLINTLQNLQASVGRDFQVIDLSIDPTETSNAAAEKKAIYLRRYGRSGAATGWHCLVGDANAISRIADELGYRFVYDPETRQYAHPSGIVVLTPQGKISRYLFGATFDAGELRDAIVAAKQGKSTSVLSQLFLLCYHYNPIAGKYGAIILSALRVASLGFVVLIGWWVFSMSRRPAKEAAPTG